MAIKDMDLEELAKYFFLILSIIGICTAIFYTFSNITLPHLINIVLVLPFIFFLTPYLVLSLYGIKRVEAKMQVIPRFLRDIVDNVESGMDLISAIKVTTGNEYSVLNEDIRKLSNQLSWGISFEKAFLNFAKNIGSKDLQRDFLLVIEARKIGGHVEIILRELSGKINIDNLRIRERKSNLASNTFTGYISFIIFIFIIILVYNSLFVGVAQNMNGSSEDSSDSNNATDVKMSIFLSLLTLLSYELAILSGFLFGLMQENNIINGAPHVVILVIMTFIGFFFFI